MEDRTSGGHLGRFSTSSGASTAYLHFPGGNLPLVSSVWRIADGLPTRAVVSQLFRTWSDTWTSYVNDLKAYEEGACYECGDVLVQRIEIHVPEQDGFLRLKTQQADCRFGCSFELDSRQFSLRNKNCQLHC